MKLKLGDYVAIEFYDHSSFKGHESSGPMKFEVVGRLVGQTDIHYILATWHWGEYGRPDHNCEYFSIIKGAVIKPRRLK